MSQWAEIRHLHLVDGVPKKEIARRLKLDVRRATCKTLGVAARLSPPILRVNTPLSWIFDCVFWS